MTGEILDRLATLGLEEWPATVSLTPDEVTAMLTLAPHEGAVCLLGAAVEQGLVSLDAASAGAVTAAWQEAMAGVVQLDGLLVQVVAWLAEAGLDCRSLKGAAVATLDECAPSWRSYHDVDVLVPADRLLAAVDALVAGGLRPLLAPVSRSWAARFGKSITLVHPSGMQVDVHRLLSPGVFGARIRPETLFAGGQEFHVGGVAVRALAAPHRFLHACYHAALGGVRGARHRRDVLLLAGSVPVQEVAALWPDGWSATVVAAALDWATQDGALLPDDWAAWRAAHVDERNDRELLHSYSGPFGEQADASARAAGPLTRLRYSWPLLWPSRAHLRDRGRSRWQHLTAVLRARRSRAGQASTS